MVFLDPFEVGEQQVHRHGASHLPNGKDPVFIPVADPKDGEVLIFQGGTWTTTNIQNVVNTYLSQLIGGLPLLPVTEEVTPVPLGVPPAPPSTPGGSDTQVQFNDSGTFGGDTGLTYDKASKLLSLTDAIAIGASPANVGLVRLRWEGFVTSSDSGGSGHYQLIGLGDRSDVLGSLSGESVIIDTFAEGTIFGGKVSIYGALNMIDQGSGTDYALVDDDGNMNLLDQTSNTVKTFATLTNKVLSIGSAVPSDIEVIQFLGAPSLTPAVDGSGSLGIASKTWGNLFLTAPTSDPNIAGQVYSMDAAGLAAELAAGSRYLLVSDGP